LAIGNNGSGNFLYAANFRAGTVDVFDTHFQKVTLAGGFTDAGIPTGFAPFDIKNINGQLFVTYAKQNTARHDDVAGAGNGFVDVFDTNGNFIRRFASQGALNSPWGLALAGPGGFQWLRQQGFGSTVRKGQGEGRKQQRAGVRGPHQVRLTVRGHGNVTRRRTWWQASNCVGKYGRAKYHPTRRRWGGTGAPQRSFGIRGKIHVHSGAPIAINTGGGTALPGAQRLTQADLHAGGTEP
jgi:hypothetical protein